MLARALQKNLAPSVTHGVADEAADLARQGRHADDHGQIETSLAGGDSGGAQGGRADEGDTGPRRRHGHEQQQVFPPGRDGDARSGEAHAERILD